MRYLIGLYCFLGMSLHLKAQQVETMFVPASKIFQHEPYLRFDPFMIDNELVKKAYSKEMRLQDKQGYLWFIADNKTLIRYDGHYTKTYDTTHYYGVYMNPDGAIWSVTDAGIALFDTLTETFRSYSSPLIKNYAHWGSVSGINGKNYILFPVTSNNVRAPFFEFDSQNKQLKHIKLPRLLNGYTQTYDSDTALVVIVPRGRSVDRHGRIWGEVSLASNTRHGRNAPGYYDPLRHQITWFPLSNVYNPEFKNSRVKRHQNFAINSILPDADGRFVWIGGWEHLGLLRFDTHLLRWKQYYFPELAANQIFTLVAYNSNEILLHTNNKLSVFNKKTETLHEYPHLPDDTFSPPLYPDAIVEGNNHTFWVGKHIANGDNEVAYVSPDLQLLQMLPRPIRKANFRLFCHHDRRFYFTYQGANGFVLSSYDERNGQEKILLRQPDGKQPEQHINMALADTVNQVIWFVGKIAGGSIWQWDLRRQRMIKVRAPIISASLLMDQLYDIMSIAQDNQGNVWIPVTQPTLGTEGMLVKYDTRSKQFIHLVHIQHLLANQRLRSVMADSRGIIWLGSWDDNLIRWFDPVTNKLIIKNDITKTTTETNVPIHKIVEDTKRGVVWIAATAHGLWKYTRHTDRWEKIRLNNTDEVINILLTDDGTLWLKSLNALIRYRPETGNVKYLGAEYDLKAMPFGSFIKGDNDELFFDRFRFFSHEIHDITSKPHIVFSFLKVFDHQLPLTQTINSLTEIKLHYNQNFFSIGFSALSYLQHTKNQYAYQLKNFNSDWIQVGNTPLATFTNVPPGEYELLIKGSNYDGVWSDVRSLKIIITPPYWQTWWFRLLIGLIALTILYAVYRYRLAQQTLKSRLAAEEALRKQEEAFRKQREAEYQQRIAQTEIAALRAQMNPHFIFNCLNSIQFYAANNDAEAASNYLTKFSRLIRLVLENSRSEKVALANELETLRLYIEMEAMRFGKKLNYEISIDPEIDIDTLQIPPLLIQPFVENAVWHGLMHKPQGGIVRIEVRQSMDSLLTVIVSDNGIGRKKATEIKSKSVTKHKSFGMKVTAERIEQINQLYKIDTQVEIIDLKDALGHVSGTQVIIQIPV